MQTLIARAEMVRNETNPPSWSVEAADADGDGGVEVTVFSGPDAEERAAEYLTWKYGAPRPRRSG